MRPVLRFAAHLARLLNTGTAVVEVRPFTLYLRLLRTLAGRQYAGLIGMGVVGAGLSAEEVAQKYFDAVLRRRLSLVRDNDTHKGHALLLALCRRGLDPAWPAAELARGDAAGHGPPAPADFADVARRLAEVDKTIGQGNPAASMRAQRGPLRLRAGAGHAEVPEELPLWDAMACAPTRLRPLAEGEEFNAFCSLAIKAVEAANDAFGAYIALGLSPFEWSGDVSVNTATKAAAFRSEVQKEGPDALRDLDAWRKAWTRRQVPGCRSADDLWRSELGKALRMPLHGRPFRIDPIGTLSDPDAVAREPEFMSEPELLKHLALCRSAGIIDDFDVGVFREIRRGSAIADLAQSPEVARRLAGAAELAAYIEELTERVLNWARRFLDDDGSGSGSDSGSDSGSAAKPSR